MDKNYWNNIAEVYDDQIFDVMANDAASFTNIEYLQADVSQNGCKLPATDFVLSVNSILIPSLEGRIRMFGNIARSLVSKGYFLLVRFSTALDARAVSLGLDDAGAKTIDYVYSFPIADFALGTVSSGLTLYQTPSRTPCSLIRNADLIIPKCIFP